MKIFLGQVLLVETSFDPLESACFDKQDGVPVVHTDSGPIGSCFVNSRSILDFYVYV